MRLTLRPYQVDALARSAAAEARGVRKQLGVAAVGMGKTVMFSALAEQRGGRTLVLAHRDELINQAAAKVLEVWPEADVGIVKAERNEVARRVVVASVQTLARSNRLAQLTAPFDGTSLLAHAAPFDLIVVDEAHHVQGDNTYGGILKALRAGEPERDATPEEVDAGCELGVMPAGPLLLGVTATPDRGDGKGLNDVFDEIVFSYDLLWGIRAGFLCDVRGKRVVVETLDMSAVKVRHGDYDVGQAGQAMEDAQADRYIVAAWLEHALGRRTLVFTPTVETARLVAQSFVGAGVKAAYVHGGTPLDERREMLRAFSAGELDVIANCGVLTEGYDEPRVDCVIMARPTRSRALFTQCIGRGTRRHPDKTDLLVLDMVGASEEHSLITIPSLFGLDKGYAERMRDGTAALSSVVQERDDELVKLGKLKAEDADLFRSLRGDGVAWVQVHHPGAELRRYVRPLGKDQPTVVLAQRGPDKWTAGLWWPATKTEPERKAVLMAEVGMELAQGVAEDFVRKQGNSRITDAAAEWRGKKPTPKQKAAAKKWRLAVDPKWTAGDLSEHLDAHIARIKARPRASR